MSAINSGQKLYIMKNTLGLRKIGISKNPDYRAREISNASGFKTEVEKVIDVQDAYKVEQLLHKHFAQYRMEGEWFKGIPARELSKKNIKRVYTKVLAEESRSLKIPIKHRQSYDFNMPCTDKDIIKKLIYDTKSISLDGRSLSQVKLLTKLLGKLYPTYEDLWVEFPESCFVYVNCFNWTIDVFPLDNLALPYSVKEFVDKDTWKVNNSPFKNSLPNLCSMKNWYPDHSSVKGVLDQCKIKIKKTLTDKDRALEDSYRKALDRLT